MKSGIVRKTIDPTRILNSVKDKGAGGTVMFFGTIRNRTNGAEVKALEYEVYRRMAERRIDELEKQIKARWPIKAIRLVQREGKLRIGEVSVAVVVSTVHRKEAFEAARFAIEQIKTSFPIWKRETFANGRKVWAKGAPITSGSRIRNSFQTSRTRNARRRRILVES